MDLLCVRLFGLDCATGRLGLRAEVVALALAAEGVGWEVLWGWWCVG